VEERIENVKKYIYPFGIMLMKKDVAKPTCIKDLELGVTLGTGSFGRVRFCTHVPSNQSYAIKILKKSGVFENHQVRVIPPI